MDYRILPVEEWHRVEPLMEATFGPGKMPHPTMAQIAVTEDDGNIVGFLVRQLMWHFEPLSIDPDYRGKANWLRMVKLLDDGQSAYVFANPDNHNERMCEIGGMTKLPFTVWHRPAQGN